MLFFAMFFSLGFSAEAKTKPASQANIIAQIKAAPYRVVDANGTVLPASAVVVQRQWVGDKCYSSIKNLSVRPVKLSNIILFHIAHTGLDPNTPIYGEGFQMLSQTEGTLGAPVDVTSYADRKHYRLTEPDGERTVYNLFLLGSIKSGYTLLGFTSSNRFAGRFSFTKTELNISMNPEGLSLSPGETWRLEGFTVMRGNDKNVLLDRFSKYIQQNHPIKKVATIPNGWCSFYYYGTDATKSNIDSNLQRFAMVMPSSKYIQIDEGYSPDEGDWLEPNPAFGSLDSTVINITKNGFLPALWVAPFIAEKGSRVLHDHPDWFVQGDDGKPLDSSTKGFGGWRHAPWYVLDGTNPAVQKHLEGVFSTMRKRWGITYFKLDANYWGTINGRHFDPQATGVEAYRRGMEAIVRGAGPNAVILGCNAPMWPSLGLVTAMRTSNDIYRSWDRFANTGHENLNRAWQSGKLWINDPDCLLLAGGKNITDKWWQFHATVVHAVGGLVMDGDRAFDLGEKQLSMLKKSIPSTGRGAVFKDDSLHLGVTDLGTKQYYYSFNWGDSPVSRTIILKKPARLTDYWTGEDLGVHNKSYTIKTQEGQSARLILAVPVR